MADDRDRKRGEADLRYVMNYDKNAGAPLQKSQQDAAQRIEDAVLPDAMVHRDDRSKMEKSD